MARELVLSLDGQEFPVNLVKIDREKLYGAIEIEAFDEKGKAATIKVLAPDGKTLIDIGGTALTTVDEKGTSIERSRLLAVDEDGEPIETVPSSFGQPNVLNQAETDDYLSQIVKSVYLLQPPPDASIDYLQDHLSGGQMYSFPFSYRGGLEYDSAFVVGGGRDAFMVIGKPAALQFVRLNQAAVLDSIEETEISGDEL
ncbi:MAG TPA: hypothetical protein VK468_09935, partial [Pyrinomonadaceae bacterium]|nr:hypothetical protein [Pyrinomonadaceae bacterium]